MVSRSGCSHPVSSLLPTHLRSVEVFVDGVKDAQAAGPQRAAAVPSQGVASFRPPVHARRRVPPRRGHEARGRLLPRLSQCCCCCGGGCLVLNFTLLVRTTATANGCGGRYFSGRPQIEPFHVDVPWHFQRILRVRRGNFHPNVIGPQSLASPPAE